MDRAHQTAGKIRECYGGGGDGKGKVVVVKGVCVCVFSTPEKKRKKEKKKKKRMWWNESSPRGGRWKGFPMKNLTCLCAGCRRIGGLRANRSGEYRWIGRIGHHHLECRESLLFNKPLHPIP